MTNFTYTYNLEDLDYQRIFCIPQEIIECDLDITYKVYPGCPRTWCDPGDDAESEIESIKVVCIYTATGSFIPSQWQEDHILFYLDDVTIDEAIWDNEINVRAGYEEEKAEWLADKDSAFDCSW